MPADNKFSSFVRQLNFYGFRKVKSNIAVEGHDTKWWEFKVRPRVALFLIRIRLYLVLRVLLSYDTTTMTLSVTLAVILAHVRQHHIRCMSPFCFIFFCQHVDA